LSHLTPALSSQEREDEDEFLWFPSCEEKGIGDEVSKAQNTTKSK